jgi:hypothetical protein
MSSAQSTICSTNKQQIAALQKQMAAPLPGMPGLTMDSPMGPFSLGLNAQINTLTAMNNAIPGCMS